MKVLLISPGGNQRNQQQDIIYDIYRDLEDTIAMMTDDIEFIPNLALLTLASYLDKGWDIRFVEEDYESEESMADILEKTDFDLACISIVNYNAMRGYEIAQKLKTRRIHTVIGGLHASSLPGEALQYADTVITGEGEEIFQVFISDFIKGHPAPHYRAEGPADLTLIPPARYDLIPNIKRYNKMPVFATRGCPHKCEFCIFPGIYGNKYRHKTVSQVIADIDAIIRLHPDPFIHFCDENLLCDRDFSRELLKELALRKVPWECFCDLGIAEDEELLKGLKKSRCRGLLVGLETLNPAVMKNIDPWKYKTLKKYEEYINRIQKAGLPITGLFIFGFDDDGESVFDDTLDFISKVGLFDMDFAVLTPMPGTPLYARFLAENRILSHNWNNYNWTHVNFQPMKMSPIKLQEGLLKLFRKFASREMLEKREKNITSARESSHSPKDWK